MILSLMHWWRWMSGLTCGGERRREPLNLVSFR
jgi:hypothetical protein